MFCDLALQFVDVFVEASAKNAMVAWVPFLFTGGLWFGVVCCCCCCFYQLKKDWALWMQLPQPVLNELGIEADNVIKLTLPKLGSTPGDTFKAQARDGRIATFTLVSEKPAPPKKYDCAWGMVPDVEKGVVQGVVA